MWMRMRMWRRKLDFPDSHLTLSAVAAASAAAVDVVNITAAADADADAAVDSAADVTA